METTLQESHDFNNNNINNNNKIREHQFEKMNQREMVAQTSLNPFLSSNYLEDLQVQEQYLTPQNSKFRTKII